METKLCDWCGKADQNRMDQSARVFLSRRGRPKRKGLQLGLRSWRTRRSVRRGFKKGDIKLGDTLVVDGYLAKDGSHLVDAQRVTLPDGRSVSGGSPGDGGPQDTVTSQNKQ
jgi:hypothetical protein